MAKDRLKLNDALCSFNIDFTDEQKEARKVIHDNVITVLTGRAGTAKSILSASVALELLNKKTRTKGLSYTPKHEVDYKEIRKIIITRPTIEAGESLGYLKGDAFDLKEGKLAPYLAPVIGNMNKLIGEASMKAIIESDFCPIETIPIQFLRGHTFENCVVILDEAQNTDLEQFKLIASRLGHNSKLIITSDWRQIDLKDRNKSAHEWLEKIQGLDGVGCYELTQNHRHPLAVKIMDVLMDNK